MAARKGRIAAQAEQIATKAADRLLDEVASGKIKGSALVPVFGVAVDKALALRGDASLTLRHEHTHRLTDDDILAFAVARSKAAQAKVVEERALPLRDACFQHPKASEKLIEG